MTDNGEGPENGDLLDAIARAERNAEAGEAHRAGGKLGYVTHRYHALTKVLRYLAQRDDGWLRMVPSLDEHIVWLKWKFTRGAWEKHYIMVRVEAMRIDWGLELLVDKLRGVDAGLKKPTRDTLYGED